MRGRRRRPGRGGGSSPVTFSSVLGSTLSHLNLGARLKEYRLKKLWPECVGEGIARRTRPERLMGSVLFCAVESSPWMTELNYQKAAIIERLTKALGPGAVTEIVFRAGAVKPRRSLKNHISPVPQRALTPEEEGFIDKTTKGIKDETLKSLIERVMRMGRR